MIDSVRSSIGLGIEYEIVLVDGGSTDGTIEWCKGEEDIVLIEQGELLGAVKAFNAGCAEASGKYVLIANDDITFIGKSILTSVIFMEDNPTVGIGCFYQDRDNKPFYVDIMGAMRDGVKIIVNYGQVCIIPKWLGEKVGWWGNYLHTYAGDNEMSCNVWELGYQVLPIPNAQIHDLKIVDELRSINHRIPNENPNSDAAKWNAKWVKPNCIGPTIPSKMAEPMQMQNKPRLMYCPIYERGFEKIQKVTKFGLRKALQKYFTVLEIPLLGSNMAIWNSYNIFKPHYVLTQIHSSDLIPRRLIVLMGRNSVVVNWNGDYNYSILSSDEYVRTLSSFDLALFVNSNLFHLYEKNGIKSAYWQIGYERYEAEEPSSEQYDVVFLGNGYSKFRYELANKLLKIDGIKLGIFGTWKGLPIPTPSNQYNFSQGDAIYRSSKIVISDCQYPEATGYVSNRLFQALYAESFVLQQKISAMTEHIGYEDGKHLVVWENLDDLERKIKIWLSPDRDEERRIIAKTGRNFTIINHSFEKRALEFVQLLQTVK
jgi:glycosyltransferase involved in cell wall biosynthesis